MKKKQLLLIAILSSVSSIHCAQVKIHNKTKQRVLARINDEKRATLFPEHSDIKRSLATHPGITLFSLGLAPAVSHAVAKRRKAKGYPSFVSINPGKAITLRTYWIEGGTAGGGPVGSHVTPLTVNPYGKPINKITFIRIKGYKTVTSTITALFNYIRYLATQYGNINLFASDANTIIYQDGLSGTKTSFPFGGNFNKQISLKIPILEEFTYNLSDHKIGRYSSAVVLLKNWKNAVFGKSHIVKNGRGGYKTIFKEMPPPGKKPTKKQSTNAFPAELKKLDKQR